MSCMMQVEIRQLDPEFSTRLKIRIAKSPVHWVRCAKLEAPAITPPAFGSGGDDRIFVLCVMNILHEIPLSMGCSSSRSFGCAFCWIVMACQRFDIRLKIDWTSGTTISSDIWGSFESRLSYVLHQTLLLLIRFDPLPPPPEFWWVLVQHFSSCVRT